MIHLLLGLLLQTEMPKRIPEGYKGRYDDSIISERGRYDPLNIGSPVQAMQEEMDYQAKERQRTQNMVEANQKQEIRNLDQESKNAIQQGKDLEALGKFSSKLAEGLVGIQVERNKAAWERGVQKYWAYGTPPEEAAAFKETEEKIIEVDKDVKHVARVAEDDGAPAEVVRQIRLNGDFEKMAFRAMQLKDAAVLYQGFVGDREDQEYDIGGGRMVSLSEATGLERGLVLQKIRSEFTQQFEGYRPVMLSEYLFPGMRKAENAIAIQHGDDQKKKLDDDRNDAIDGQLMMGLKDNTGGETVKFLLDHYEDDFGSARAVRKYVWDKMYKLAENKSITDIQLDSTLTYRFKNKNGKEVSIEEQWPEFASLRATLRDARIDENTRIEKEQKMQVQEWGRKITDATRLRIEQGKGYWSDAEKETLIQEFKDEFPGLAIPDELNKILTMEEADDQTIINRIKEKQALSQPIVIEDLYGLSRDKMIEWLPKVSEDAPLAAIPEWKLNGAKTVLTARIKKIYGMTEGDANISDNDDASMMLIRAYDDFRKVLAQELKVTENADAAYEQAIAKVLKKGLGGETLELEKGAQDLNLQEKSYYATDRANSSVRAQGNLNKAVKYIDDNPQGWMSAQLPGSGDALKALRNYQLTGTGEIPDFYEQVARQYTGFDAFALANQQLRVVYGPDAALLPSPRQQQLDGMTPEVKQLLTYMPTASRDYRAAVTQMETEGATQTSMSTKTESPSKSTYGGVKGQFLDLAGSVESEAYGGYDAYNLGGSQGGHRAHGSGNSATDGRFGKPISQLTVQEIIDLGLAPTGRHIFAAGRYQFIPSTLREIVKYANIDTSKPFDARMQDDLALARARWRMDNDNHQGLAAGLRREWIGFYNVEDAVLTPMARKLNIEIKSPWNRPENLAPGVRNKVYANPFRN